MAETPVSELVHARRHHYCCGILNNIVDDLLYLADLTRKLVKRSPLLIKQEDVFFIRLSARDSFHLIGHDERRFGGRSKSTKFQHTALQSIRYLQNGHRERAAI